MKKVILLFSLILIASSQALAIGYLDLFSDEAHTEWCIYPQPGVPYVSFDLYLYARPPDDGFRATECKLVVPDTAMKIVSIDYHPSVNLAFGEWSTGMSLAFAECMTDPWVLCAHFTVLAYPSGIQPGCQAFELSERIDSNFFGFATCLPGFPAEDAWHEKTVYVNCDPCPSGAPDVYPPYMLWAQSISLYEVEAQFNEKVTVESAEAIENYSAYRYSDPMDTLVIASVSLLEDSQTIHVTFSDAIIEDVPYWLSARNIYDYYGNACDETGSLFGLAVDLTVLSVDVIPDKFRKGCEEITIFLEIENLGISLADSFYTSIYLRTDVGDPPETYLLRQVLYPGLSAGSILQDSVATVLPPGTKANNDVIVVADDPPMIVELDESNNEGSIYRYCFAPRIFSIEDIPYDQGGFVEIYFARCNSDREHIVDSPIVGYEIFRRNDLAGNDWEIVGWVPAENEPTYLDTVPTLVDATEEIYWSVFYIRVVRPIVDTGDTLYYYSCPDSGYSVENIPVATLLQNFNAAWDHDAVAISWQLAETGTTLEFDVLRQEENGEFERITNLHVTQEGARYSYSDRDVESGKSYRYRVFYQEGGGQQLLFETDVISVPSLPLTLYQNYPNPFNPSTSIRFYLPEDSHVTLDIYDVSGTRVTSLIHGKQSKGFRTVVWDGKNDNGGNVSSGIYFYRLKTGKQYISKKMILLR